MNLAIAACGKQAGMDRERGLANDGIHTDPLCARLHLMNGRLVTGIAIGIPIGACFAVGAEIIAASIMLYRTGRRKRWL